MKPENIEANAKRLYFSYPNSYFAKGEEFKEILPPSCALIGRLIFIIVDFFRGGKESKKVHDLALETLNSMEKQMESDWPRWHLDGDERYGMYPGCPVLGHTYKELAERLQKKHPLKKYDDIQAKAQAIILKFDNLSFFKDHAGLPKEVLIRQATNWDHSPNDPSISAKEIENLLKESIKS